MEIFEMAKKKSKKSKVTLYNATGVVFKDILWYYDTNAAFWKHCLDLNFGQG